MFHPVATPSGRRQTGTRRLQLWGRREEVAANEPAAGKRVKVGKSPSRPWPDATLGNCCRVSAIHQATRVASNSVDMPRLLLTRGSRELADCSNPVATPSGRRQTGACRLQLCGRREEVAAKEPAAGKRVRWADHHLDPGWMRRWANVAGHLQEYAGQHVSRTTQLTDRAYS